MSYKAFDLPSSSILALTPALTRQTLERLVAATLITLLLSQTLLTISPVAFFEKTTAVALPMTADPVALPLGLSPVTPPLPPLWLPPELVGKPEVVAMRSAHSATYVVGNNTYATVQELDPIHFQDQSGAWQRIDPTWVETPLGWLNGTNAVRTLVAKRSSTATIAAQDVSLQWQPQGLVVADMHGDRELIAEPLPVASAGRATVDASATTARYTASWSLEGLQDQWQIGAGRSEYTMRLPELPATAWWRGEPHALDLRVRLQLNPGTTLQVDGAPVSLPFATQRPITFVGANGEAMVLQPPRTYEQANPDASVDAEYLLTATEDADVVELRVRTPWDWLAEPERNFPVIIDPVFQIRNGTYVGYATYFPKTGEFNNVHDFSLTRLGRSWELTYRPLIRFAMPTTPVGTTVAKAFLHAVPDDINNGENFDFTRAYLKTRVFAHALNPDWEMSSSGPTFDTEPLSPGPQFMEFSRGADIQKSVVWDVTTQAQSWLQHPGVPSNNPGILLRTENERCEPEITLANLKVPDLGCGAFYFNDVATNWTQMDLELTNGLTRPDSLYINPHSQSGGIRLVVYFNGATLNHDSISPAPGSASLPLPPGEPPYFKASNVYTVPPMPDNKWQAFVSRGFGPSVGQNPPPQSGQIFSIPLEGATPLALRRSAPGQAPLTEKQLRTVTPAEDTVSYILFNGRGQAATDFDANTLLYVESSAGISGTTGYDVRSMSEVGSIASPLGTTTETFYEFESTDPLALWNLELPTPSQVGGAASRLIIDITSDQTNTGLALSTYGRFFQAQVINSASQADLPTSPQINAQEAWNYNLAEFTLDQDVGGPLQQPFGPVRLTSRIFSPGEGQHALVLAYNGPEIIANDLCDPQLCGPELAATNSENPGTNSVDETADIIPVKYLVRVRTLTCPAGTFPLKNGQCQVVKCPTSALVPQGSPLYQEAGNLGLWSLGGWQADGVTSITPPITTPPPAASVIGPTQRGLPSVAVLEGRVRYNKNLNPDAVTIEGDATILLIQCQPEQELYTKYFQVFEGAMTLNQVLLGTTPTFVPNPHNSGDMYFSPWQESDKQFGDVQSPTLYLKPATDGGTATGNATLRRRTGMEASALKDLLFTVNWTVNVDGFPSLTSSVAIDDLSQTPDKIASLAFSPGQTFEMDIPPAGNPPIPTQPRLFEAVRVLDGSVIQDARMGGASKPVRALILPPTVAMEGDATTYCPRSCIDVRAPDDTRTQPNRRWAMPDIHTNTQPGMVAMSTPGNLTVFSQDAPNANPAAADFTQEFSFDAFNATVSVEQDYCLTAPDGTPIGPMTLVIKGETHIAMPNIGSPGDTSGVTASFKLCDLPPDGLGLRSVHLSFSSPVGLLLGTSGLFLTGLEGGVAIYPEYTEIRFGLDFQTEPSGPGGILKGHGNVLISTLGLFEYQGGAKLLGVVNAEGHLWVAWNPIDVGFDVSISLGGWLTGNAHAHMWKGRGFYNYTWLPDNNDMHFTAGVSAFITIEEGAIIDAAPVVVPWDDIVFGVKLEFGEFCTNNSCTSYEWGVKGVFVFAGYNVGLYYGFDEGLDFILGNDDHILIDQYGSALAAAGHVTDANRVAFTAAPAQVDGTVLIPFNVSGQSEQILVGVGWQAGAPALTLIDPTGAEITPDNAATHQAEVTNAPTATYVTVQMPKPGAWQAKLSNLSEAGIEHYKFAYFSNKGAPGTPGNRGHFHTPGDGQSQPVDGFSSIQWEVPSDTPSTAKISLYFQRTEVITGNLLIDVPIVKNLPFSEGSYNWDTRKLLNGSYKVRAVVDDGVNDLPVGQISQPDDFCTPATSGLPPARAFDPNRFPGTVEFTSTGTIQIADSIAPDAPTGLAGSTSQSALRVTWNAPAAVDVAGYLLRWGPQRVDNPQSFHFNNQALVLAGEELTYHIGTVTNGMVYGVDIAALDVNGNASAASAPIFLTPDAASNPVPAVPTALALTSRTSTSASFQWQAGVGPAAASYELHYVRTGNSSEIGAIMVDATSGSLADLPTGASYDVRVRAFNSAGWASAYYSETVRVLITDGVDGNGDGMADDWAAAYGLTSASDDTDGDGINNGTEYTNGTNPTLQDSDGDGFSDKEEVDAGTDMMNGLIFGATTSQPRLMLEQNRLRFYGKDQDGGLPAVQQVMWANTGGGSLVLQATTTESWLQATVVDDKVQVGVDSDALAPGFYSGVVHLVPGQGSDPIIGDPACIRVNTWVAYGDNDVPSIKQTQTINFPSIADRTLATPPFAVSASASSGLPVTIVSSTPAACTVAGNMVTLLTEATCTLVASQAGNDVFSAAPNVLRSFTILPEGYVYTTYLTQILNTESAK